MAILVVEDNRALASNIIEFLEAHGFECDYADNGKLGLKLAIENTFDVIILDIMLPGLDGLQVCQSLRNQGFFTPVLMLTARDSLEDKLKGFDVGTDDYLVKPFAMEELIVRTKVLAKRRSGQISKLMVADVVVDLQQNQAFRDNKALNLSPTGLKILEILMRASPESVSREKIMQRIWGDDQPDSNSLKVHIFNLRKQIDSAYTTKLIHTISGHGFSIKEANDT